MVQKKASSRWTETDNEKYAFRYWMFRLGLIGNEFIQYIKGRYSLDMLLIIMTQFVGQFQIGILVIDEIQHLGEAKGGGSDKMLNFFVTLVNTIGLPVVLIGTKKAMSILQGEFRQAKRGSGQGDLIWDRMKNDAVWQVFVKSMWRYQWTGNSVPYTDEMVNTLYNESQGIIDIAVKLYAILQIEAITGGRQSFTASDIHKVAEKKLSLVKPMLDALRSGDRKIIMRYEDITPVSIEDYLSVYQTMPVYSLFQSDRKNSDGDSEVQDSLKEAVKQIINDEELQQTLASVAEVVETKLQEVSNRTLEKLREMEPAVETA